MTPYASSGFASFRSANPRASILSASISFASMSSRVARCNVGITTSSTIDRPARTCSDAARWRGDDFESVGETRRGFASRERKLPRNSFDSRRDPAASTRFTGRTVSILRLVSVVGECAVTKSLPIPNICWTQGRPILCIMSCSITRAFCRPYRARICRRCAERSRPCGRCFRRWCMGLILRGRVSCRW